MKKDSSAQAVKLNCPRCGKGIQEEEVRLIITYLRKTEQRAKPVYKPIAKPVERPPKPKH